MHLPENHVPYGVTSVKRSDASARSTKRGFKFGDDEDDGGVMRGFD